MTVRAAMLVAAASWALLLGGAGYVIVGIDSAAEVARKEGERAAAIGVRAATDFCDAHHALHLVARTELRDARASLRQTRGYLHDDRNRTEAPELYHRIKAGLAERKNSVAALRNTVSATAPPPICATVPGHAEP